MKRKMHEQTHLLTKKQMSGNKKNAKIIIIPIWKSRWEERIRTLQIS